MEIDVAEGGQIRITKAFSGVIFETDDGEKMSVCIRDGAFEIAVKDTTAKANCEYYRHYRVCGGAVIPLDGGATMDLRTAQVRIAEDIVVANLKKMGF